MSYEAWIDTRVSSTGQGRGDSLEIQERKGKSHLWEEYGIPAHKIKVFREKYSGRKGNRPLFEAILAFSKQHQTTLKYGCFTNIDRFTRAGGEFYAQAKRQLKTLGIQLVDVEGVIQPERNFLRGSGGKFGDDFEYSWSVYSPSEEAELREAERANKEGCRIVQRFIEKQIDYAQQGYQNRAATYGFKNIKLFNPKTGKERAITALEPKEAHFITKMYSYTPMIVKGAMTVRDVCDKLNTMGYRSRVRHQWNEDKSRIVGKSGGIRLTPKQYWKYIRDVKNCGFISEKWTHGHLVPSKGAKIVTIEQWNLANANHYEIIKDKNTPKGWRLIDLKKQPKRTYRKINPDFPFRGLICCPVCGKMLKSGASTGRSGKRYPFYFCNRGHKQVSITPKDLYNTLHSFLKSVAFDRNSAKALISAVRINYAYFQEEEQIWQNNTDTVLQQQREKADVTYKKLMILTNPDLIKRCEKDYENIQNEIAIVESTPNPKSYKIENIDRTLRYIEKVVEHPCRLLLNADTKGFNRILWSCFFPTTPSLEELRGRTAETSVLIKEKNHLKNSEDKWWSIKDHSRTVFDEISRWETLLKDLNDEDSS